jgi:hypothetical protein
LIFLGLNPSTAEPKNLDQTLKSVERITIRNDFTSWVALNLYPQRATNPNELHALCDRSLHRSNLKHIENVLMFAQPVIWAAWGTGITKRPYLLDCLMDIYDVLTEYDCSWVTFGLVSKDGHPHHPLYLRQDSEMKDFDIEGYFGTIKKKYPKCKKNDRVVPIIYGEPSPEAMEIERKGLRVNGGCRVDSDSPKWYCKRDRKEF